MLEYHRVMFPMLYKVISHLYGIVRERLKHAGLAGAICGALDHITSLSIEDETMGTIRVSHGEVAFARRGRNVPKG